MITFPWKLIKLLETTLKIMQEIFKRKVKENCSSKLMICQEISSFQYFGFSVYSHIRCEQGAKLLG